jgi:hypothetical protein
VRTVIKRLQQLEKQHVEYCAAVAYTTGARERILAQIARMSGRLQSDPNCRPPEEAAVTEIKERLKLCFASRGERGMTNRCGMNKRKA